MRALIFGAGGQAGYYMTRFLNKKGYEVTALNHRDCDITESYSVSNMLNKFQPDEVYNFASKMFAPDSWNSPLMYIDVNLVGVLNILECYFSMKPDGKFFQAGSAEIFGRHYFPQREDTPIKPRNPYGLAKAAAQDLVRIYREEKKMFACTGILFNMESSRRKDTFFTRKVIKGLVDIFNSKSAKLTLGDLSVIRDWGLVEEYVEAMWLMLQANEPDDYVIGTGESASCLAFVREACTALRIDIDTSVEYELSPKYPPDAMEADPYKIYHILGWRAKTKFPELVKHLVAEELKNTMVAHILLSW